VESGIVIDQIGCNVYARFAIYMPAIIVVCSIVVYRLMGNGKSTKGEMGREFERDVFPKEVERDC